MLLCAWLIATTLVVQAKGQASACRKPYVDYLRSERGGTLGLITVRNPGGQYALTVTLHSRVSSAGAGNGDREGVKLYEESNGDLKFLVHLPSEPPRSIINAVVFNGHTICNNGGNQDTNGLLVSTYTTGGYKSSSSSFGIGNSNSYGPDSLEDASHLIERFRESTSGQFPGRGPSFDPEIPGLFFGSTGSKDTSLGSSLAQEIQGIQDRHFGSTWSKDTRPQPIHDIDPISVRPIFSKPEVARPTPVTSINNKEVSCGVSSHPRALVLGGEATERGDWPWLAALVLTENLNFFCGSTIISKKHVITAAHCMFDVTKPGNPQHKVEDIAVWVGKHNITNLVENRAQFISVKRMIIHENYKPKSMQNDITILLLAEPVEYSSIASPICLWMFNPDSQYIRNKNATLIGWGLTEKNEQSDIPLKAVVPIVDTEMCVNSHEAIRVNIDPDSAVCAGEKNGVGPCRGDSGSALAIQFRSNHGVLRWYLRGIVSYNAPGNTAICDLNNYSVYTDAAKFMLWINESMKLR